MDQTAGIGFGNMTYYRPLPPLKAGSGSGYQFMASVSEPNTKNMLFNGAYFYHNNCGISEPSAPMDYVRDGWLQNFRDKNQQPLNMGGHHNFAFLPEPQLPQSVQMLQQAEPPLALPSTEKTTQPDDPNGKKGKGSKRRAQGNSQIAPKPKKPKKNPVPKDEAGKCKASRSRALTVRKTADIVINGTEVDISSIPTPVCSCTGKAQQCYRWGLGGWQSACCTTSISMYPLPMSTKRRGARIAGRKMSLGAFKKVLEKLAGEGYHLLNPIDLKSHWAKHGTNKFVVIR